MSTTLLRVSIYYVFYIVIQKCYPHMHNNYYKQTFLDGNIIIIQEMLKELLTQYSWELVPEQDLTYKVLPVCRPKEDVRATFTRTVTSS